MVRDITAIAIGTLVAVAVIYLTWDVRGHDTVAQIVSQLTQS
jgi:hypothetical protein